MKPLKFVVRQIVPLIFSYVFVGLACGILLSDAGYSPLWAFLSGLLVYAGAMQIVMVSLLAAGAPLYVVAATTLFVNGRHIFYGVSFVDEFRAVGKRSGSFLRAAYMALTVTDETYSVLCSLRCPPDVDRGEAEFWILFLCHVLWVVSCTLGAVLGCALPVDTTGIDFSATAFFAAVVVNQWRDCPSHIPAVTGFVSAAVFYVLVGPDDFILPALSVSVAALLMMKSRVGVKAAPEGAHE